MRDPAHGPSPHPPPRRTIGPLPALDSRLPPSVPAQRARWPILTSHGEPSTGWDGTERPDMSRWGWGMGMGVGRSTAARAARAKGLEFLPMEPTYHLTHPCPGPIFPVAGKCGSRSSAAIVSTSGMRTRSRPRVSAPNVDTRTEIWARTSSVSRSHRPRPTGAPKRPSNLRPPPPPLRPYTPNRPGRPGGPYAYTKEDD